MDEHRANHEDLPRRTAADTTDDVSRVLGKLEASGQDLTILRLLANDPAVFRPFVVMANALMYRASLPADVRETVILWIAHHLRSSYEWVEHDPISRRAGLSDEQIDSLRRGDLTKADEAQSVAASAVRQLLTKRSLPPSMWNEMVGRWGLDGAVELVLTAGWWGGLVPTVIDALGLEAPDSLRSVALPVFE